MPLRALFFDFDGLIVDTESPQVEIWQELFAEHGVVLPDANWIFSIGRGADQIEEPPIVLLERLLGRAVDATAIADEYERRLTERLHAQPVLPGVVELAAAARSAGLIVYVVSSSHHDWVDGFLSRLGLVEYFERTVCRDDAARAKPFPDLYLRACELAEIQPSEAVALETPPTVSPPQMRRGCLASLCQIS